LASSLCITSKWSSFVSLPPWAAQFMDLTNLGKYLGIRRSNVTLTVFSNPKIGMKQRA
jgi:hypothetical protein